MSFDYKDDLALISEWGQRDLSLDQIAIAMRDRKLTERSRWKRAAILSQTRQDIEFVGLPCAAGLVECPMELCEDFVRLIILWQLEPLIDAADTVVELGAGVGLLSAFIARANAQKRVIATDREPTAVSCIHELSQVAALHNLTAAQFDLITSDVNSLDIRGNVLFIASGVFVLLPEAGKSFLQRLLTLQNTRLCLFEPIGDQMTPPSKFIGRSEMPQMAKWNPKVWETIQRSGFNIERVITDLVGEYPALPLSLVQISNVKLR